MFCFFINVKTHPVLKHNTIQIVIYLLNTEDVKQLQTCTEYTFIVTLCSSLFKIWDIMNSKQTNKTHKTSIF